MESAERRIHRHDLFERLFLHGEVRMHVGVGGLDAFVTQPERNHGDIDPALKQSHRGAVTNYMGRDPFSLKAWTTAGCSLYCFAKQEVDGKPRKWFAPDVGERPGVITPSNFPQPLPDRAGSLGPERNSALLPALSKQVQVALYTET